MAIPAVALGNTGIWVSKLGIGTGTDGWGGSSKQTRLLGLKGLSELLANAFQRGITLFDTADQYGSHAHVRLALEQVPRKEVTIVTKTVATTASQMRSDLERFRKELDSEYLDVVLLHGMTDTKWNRRLRPVMEELQVAKEQGIVRAVGCSVHHVGALSTCIREPWVDVVLVRLNPRGINMDGETQRILPLLQALQEAGKGLLGMKVLGKGEIQNIHEAFRFQLESPVDAFIVGMESRQQLEENIRVLEQLLQAHSAEVSTSQLKEV